MHKTQITLKQARNDKSWLRFSSSGVLQIKQGNEKTIRRVFSPARRLTFRIATMEGLSSQDCFFVVKVTDDSIAYEVEIEGKEQLEKLWKIMSEKSVIMGLEDMVETFRRVGEGSFAQVFQAVTIYKAKMALKCFEKKLLAINEKKKKGFLNQIEVLRKLSCPYIVAYDYLFETDRAFYIKMEYFPRRFRDKLHTTKLLMTEQKEILKQLLIALVQLKSKGIIHRDIKPDNIMLRINPQTGKQECVLIDLGLATEMYALPYLYVRCGTPGYLAPQIANLTDKLQRQTCAADMFSLGCVFFKMVTGRSLFSAKTAQEVMQLNRKCELSSQIFQNLSAKEKDLLQKMLKKDPNNRITPEQALKHPYFEQDIDDSDDIPDQECPIEKKILKITSSYQIKNMAGVCCSQEASLASQERRNRHRKSSIKDSCLTFEFGSKSQENSEQTMKKIANPRKPEKRRSRFSQLAEIQYMI